MLRVEILKNLNKNLDHTFVLDNNTNYKYKDILHLTNLINQYSQSTIGLYFDKSAHYVLSTLSIFLSKHSFVPLDKKQPEERLNYFYQDSKIDFIISSLHYKNDTFLNDKNVLFIEDILNNNNEFDFFMYEKKHLYTIYTSGSTGIPKGVIIDNEFGLYNVIKQQIDILKLYKENIFLFLSISFDASLSDILCSFFSQSTLYINDNILLRPKKLLTFFNNHKITYSDLPPSLLKLFKPQDFLTFNKMIIGGEVPDYETVINYVKHDFLILNVYGPTEASICTSMILCNKEWNSKNIGFPINNIEYYIINGELIISGEGVAKGYTNNNITNERFYLENNKRYYKTGDIVEYTPFGYIFKGRKDRQIKHNGQLICLEEIEEKLKSIPSILNTSVIYENKKIICYYEGNIKQDEIVSELKKYIPVYMIPHFFVEGYIPKTSSGKNDSKSISYYSKKNLLNHSEYLFNKLTTLQYSTKNTTNHVLITGATGKLGFEILNQLKNKKISIIVRKINDELLSFCNINNVTIYISKGLEYDYLGLSKEDYHYLSINIDEIYHCAANINNLKSFHELYNDNIISSINIAKFSMNINFKFIHYMSTLSVYVSVHNKENNNFLQKSISKNEEIAKNGYTASKIVSEYFFDLFFKQFSNVHIYRLGLILDNSLSQNSYIYLLFKNLKYIPIESTHYSFDYTPLKQAVYVMLNNTFSNYITHVTFNCFISLNDIQETLNIPLKPFHNIKSGWIYEFTKSLIGQKQKHDIFEMTNMPFFETDECFSIPINKKDYIISLNNLTKS